MEEDEFVVVDVEAVLARHREGIFVEIAVDVEDHVPLDVTIDHDLGDRRRHVGSRGDGDGEAGIIVLVDPIAHRILRHEVHSRPAFERDEARPGGSFGCPWDGLLLERVDAGLQSLELRLQIGQLLGAACRGKQGERHTAEQHSGELPCPDHPHTPQPGRKS
jgi:hypothetical protein